ncbi:MAG: YIP1 family protein [Burkholderiales bacterium]|nr:YIP1 family protein [Burkholderiales bacterium]
MNIVARVKNILLSPIREWAVIDGEEATINSLYTNYAVILALIPAVAGFIGNSLVGMTVLGMTFRTPIVAGLVMAIVMYVIGLAMLYVFALVINALAPKFDGQANLVQAFKVAVYGATAVWVASILTIVPALGVLVLLAAIYSLVLYWLGLPKLMKVPEEKKIGFNITVFVCMIVVGIVVSVVMGAIGAGLGVGAAAWR